MREFFRGWRRKAGCVTLMMALSLMAGWIRSLYPDVPSPVPGQFVFDEQSWKIGCSFHRVDHAVHRFSLKDSCVTWERIQADAPIMVNNLIGVWLNASDANFPDVGIQSNDWIAKQEWCGFARGRFHLRDDRFNLRIARLVLPFWAIVIPLTLLSAVLILWPRKRPTKQSAPSLVAGKLSWTLSNAIMHDTQAKHDRLWKLIEEAQAESDQAKANSIFCDAEQLARHLHEAEPDDAEHCYAIALTY